MKEKKIKQRYIRTNYIISGILIAQLGKIDLVLGWKIIFGIIALFLILFTYYKLERIKDEH